MTSAGGSDRIGKMLTRARWRTNLRLVDWYSLALDKVHTALRDCGRFYDTQERFEAWLDRVSPWVQNTGYKRTWLRRWAHRLASNAHRRTLLWRAILSLVERFAPYTGPGKFEGNERPDALKVAWLYDHMEYATIEAGDLTEYPLYQSLFTDLDVPWSREPESWIVEVDENGFVIGEQFIDATHAKISFGGFEYRYGLAMANAESDGDDGMWPEVN